MTPLLDVRTVSLQFGGVRALDDVSLTVEPGQVIGLIGPNGAGKTSLFDVIGGFTAPSAGSVWFADHDVTSWRPQRRALAGLGRGFQDAALFGALTVREVLAIACARRLPRPRLFSTALGLPDAVRAERDIADAVDTIIASFGLDDYVTKFVSELSTGTRRVIELAAVAAQQPRLLLLDEPSSGIAQREVEALGGLIRRIQQSLGCALLIIEHDIPMVAAIADELVAMDAGAVVVRDVPDRVLVHPHVVASYLGVDERTVARSEFGAA